MLLIIRAGYLHVSLESRKRVIDMFRTTQKLILV
mgnify:CR=1 FL=1